MEAHFLTLPFLSLAVQSANEAWCLLPKYLWNTAEVRGWKQQMKLKIYTKIPAKGGLGPRLFCVGERGFFSPFQET